MRFCPFARRVLPFPLLPLLLLGFCLGGGATAQAAASPTELIAAKGTLPASGRVTIRSALAWMPEDHPLFAAVARALETALTRRGLTVVATEPSLAAPFPKGIGTVRGAAIPRSKGGRKRIMSVAEAAARMKAMQLAREGKLPQAKFGGAERGKGAGLADLAPREMIRFALSQEEGEPELGGRVTVPGRLPDEARTLDPFVAEYTVTARFAMLWPGSGIPDEPQTLNSNSGLAVGWHLLELDCYDLAPARQGKAPERIWEGVAQRVAFGAYLRGMLPRMAADILGQPE